MPQRREYILSGSDEFNSINIANFYELKNTGVEYYTEATKTFDILFNNFDKIVQVQNNYLGKNYFSQYDPITNNVNNVNDTKAKLRHWFETNNIAACDLSAFKHQQYFSEHIYVFLFCTLSKQLQENTLNWIVPKRADYVRVQQELAEITKPIISVHGRNLQKHPLRNLLLEKYIERIIQQGGFVINTTITPPGLNFPSDSYREVARDDFSYSEQLSYFLNSNCVIAVGNGAGINHHLATPANICTFNYHDDSWIHHPTRKDLRHNGRTVIQARQARKDVVTFYKKFNDVSVIGKCLTMPKPTINTFFDESKIIPIDLA